MKKTLRNCFSGEPAKSPPEEKVIPIRLADSEDLDDLDLEDNTRASGPLKGCVDADLRSEYENHFSPLKQEPKRPAGSSVGTGARPKSTESPTPTPNPEPKQPSTPAHPPSSLRKQVLICYLIFQLREVKQTPFC